MVFYLPGIPVCILPNRGYFHNWVPQIALESGFVVIIILDNHPLAIAFRYFCKIGMHPLQLSIVAIALVEQMLARASYSL